MPKQLAVTLLATLLISGTAWAELQTRDIEYEHDGTTLTGYLVWDDTVEGKSPGILVAHEWWGLNDYVKRRTRDLAKLGYVAFALDMYGSGKSTEHGDEAGAWMGQITENIDSWQERAMRGLEILREQPQVDADRIGAVGYCFGGATVMQMAYAGAELSGVVSFHGSLPIPDEEQIGSIRAPILAANGAADEFVPPKRIQAFQDALRGTGTDWHMVIYGGARHGFTNPDAAQYGVDNIEYNEQAAQRSRAHMERFFEEVFQR